MVALSENSNEMSDVPEEMIVSDVPLHDSEIEVNTIWGFPKSIDPDCVIMMGETEVALELESDARTRKAVMCKERGISKRGRLLANSWCSESWSEVIDQFYTVPNYEDIICKPERQRSSSSVDYGTKLERSDTIDHKPSRYSEQDNRCPKCKQTFLTQAVLSLHMVECQTEQISPGPDEPSDFSLKRSRSSSPSSSTSRVSRATEESSLTTYNDLNLRDKDGTYHCNFCPKVFITMNEMRTHCKDDHNSKAFKCKICDGLFANARSLLMHTYTHTGEKPFKCSYCPMTFRQLSHRTGHIKSIHADDQPYPCEECTARFVSQLELNKHKKTSHVKKSDHNCHHCGKIFSTMAHTKNHMVKCRSRTRTVKCGGCEEMFYTLRDLQIHSNFCRAGDAAGAVCKSCDETFPTISKYSLHTYLCIKKRKVKSEEEVSEADVTVDEGHALVIKSEPEEAEKCVKCGTMFDRASYKEHILICCSDTTCSYCSRVFKTPTNLKKHLHHCPVKNGKDRG